MTENDKKKEYLNSYRNLCNKIKSLEDQFSSLRAVEMSPKIQKLSDMPKGNKQSDLSDLIVKEEKLCDKINQLRVEAKAKQLEIEDCIADMEDGLESSVLLDRYICLRSWDLVAYDLGYTTRQIYRLHGRALQNFKMS